jgi:hypothetical protein
MAGMQKVKIAFYDCTGLHEDFVKSVQRTRRFSIRRVPCGSGKGGGQSLSTALDVLRRFNPHIVVVRLPGDGVLLCKSLRKSMHVLPIVLTTWATDPKTLKRLERAGIQPWQVIDTAMTSDSFAELMIDYAEEHIMKPSRRR